MHLLRTKTAVNAERVYAQALEHGNRGIHRAAGQQLTFFVENQRYEHRQIAVFLGSQHSRLGLVAVAHGLNQDEVGACLCPRGHHLFIKTDRCRTDANGFSEQLDRPFKRQVAHRLEQLAGRADVKRDIGILSACLLTRGFCMRNRSLHDFLQVIRIFEGICTESIGVHHITAGFKVAAVQRNNLIRMGQVPRFRQFTGF